MGIGFLSEKRKTPKWNTLKWKALKSEASNWINVSDIWG